MVINVYPVYTISLLSSSIGVVATLMSDSVGMCHAPWIHVHMYAHVITLLYIRNSIIIFHTGHMVTINRGVIML